MQNAGENLKKIFIAEVGFLVCIVLSVIPIIGMIGKIGKILFIIFSMLGLYGVGQTIRGCKNAFYLSVGRIGVIVLSVILKGAVFSTLISVTGDVIDVMIIYFVCTSVAESLNGAGVPDVAEIGNIVWKITVVCGVISILVQLISVIPIINIIAGVVNLIVSLVELAASILYIIFLYKSYQVLLG